MARAEDCDDGQGTQSAGKLLIRVDCWNGNQKEFGQNAFKQSGCTERQADCCQSACRVFLSVTADYS